MGSTTTIFFAFLSLWSCLASVLGQNVSSAVTPTTSLTTTSVTFNPNYESPNRTSAWERHALLNLSIIGVVVLIIVGGLFFIRYARTERKATLRRYARLSKTEEDEDDIELSIYEKK